MRQVLYTTLFFLTGLIVFYLLADFDSRYWQYAYGFWDKLKDLLLLLLVANLLRTDKQRKVLEPVTAVASLRLVWEVVSFFTGLTINNSLAVAILFSIAVAISIFYTLKYHS